MSPIFHPILKKSGDCTPNKTPQKVHFESKLQNVLEIMSSFVKNGEEKKVKELAEILISPLTQDEELESILIQMRDNIFIFDDNNNIIVSFLLKMTWSSRSDIVVKAYQNLILNLVSADTNYLNVILEMLISHFLPRREDKTLSETPTESERLTFDRVHKILDGILKIVPSAPRILLETIQSRFPYLQRETYLQVCYVYNLLAICRYGSEVRQQILELIVNRMLQLDVHCPPQEILDAEEDGMDGEDDGGAVFEMDTQDETDAVKDEVKVESVETSLKHPLANALDHLMKLSFEFICDVCKDQDDLDWEATKKLYKEFLVIFDKLILPTLGCAHSQYVMFYVISLRPPLHEGFLDYLWKKVQDPNVASIIRQASVSYVGSLLSRAKYIGVSTVMACFDVMCPWIHSYINNQEGTSKVSVDAAIHGPFYAVCQAVFYVFAFRHKEFTDTNKGLRYLRSLNFERMVACRLNPLKICSPVIVKNFANVARNYQLAYCYTIIERNNRCVIPEVTDSMCDGHLQQISKLSTFFPFDPYLLSKSSYIITPLYRIYDGNVEIDKVNADVIEDEDDFLENHEHAAVRSPTCISNSGDYFSYKFSPGFKQIISPKKHSD